MANGSHKLKHRKDSLFIVDSFNYVITCKFQGVLPLPNDRAVRLRFSKMDPTWDSFFEKFGKNLQKKVTLNETEIPKFPKVFYFSQIFQKKYHMRD